MTKTLVIIPVHNEEETITEVIEELCKYYQGDALIVDDGSTDNSISKINACIKSKLKLITHPKKLGYGAALITGFNFAIQNNYELIVTMDCDCQHEPKQVPDFFKSIGNLDILSGSRYLVSYNGNDSAPADRQNINKLITAELNKLTKFNLTDSFCGFKAYKTEAIKKLKLTEAGYGFPLQFWLQAWKAQLKLGEIPVKRIYKNLNRSFGPELDDPERRLKYYQQIICREFEVCRSAS